MTALYQSGLLVPLTSEQLKLFNRWLQEHILFRQLFRQLHQQMSSS